MTCLWFSGSEMSSEYCECCESSVLAARRNGACWAGEWTAGPADNAMDVELTLRAMLLAGAICSCWMRAGAAGDLAHATRRALSVPPPLLPAAVGTPLGGVVPACGPAESVVVALTLRSEDGTL